MNFPAASSDRQVLDHFHRNSREARVEFQQWQPTAIFAVNDSVFDVIGSLQFMFRGHAEGNYPVDDLERLKIGKLFQESEFEKHVTTAQVSFRIRYLRKEG